MGDGRGLARGGNFAIRDEGALNEIDRQLGERSAFTCSGTTGPGQSDQDEVAFLCRLFARCPGSRPCLEIEADRRRAELMLQELCM